MNKTGRKIWYGTAIALSGLVLLLCVVSIAGVWVVECFLSDAVVQVIEAVDGVTSRLREVTVRGRSEGGAHAGALDLHFDRFRPVK